MEVILLQHVDNLGHLGDKVKVKAGYARNYLLPQGKATEANEANLAKFEARRAELEKAANEALADAQQRSRALENTVVTIAANAAGEGRLFGSVGPAEIADAVTATGTPIGKREVQMSTGAIRQIGEYDVTIRLHSQVEVIVRVNVMAT